MWTLLCVILGTLITWVTSWFPPGDAGFAMYASRPHGIIGALMGGVAVFGLFVDLPVLFLCAATLLVWRIFWLGVKVYANILHLIPFAG